MATVPHVADPHRVLTIILGGGAGTRLFPLTRDRSKPAVPLAGKYRLVDIPISNSINSEMQRIFLLTQFLSASLHRHVYGSFKFDAFSQGFVEILAAVQRPADASWYQGTADAVRKNLHHFRELDFDFVLILSGDQLYRMDFREMLHEHVEADAELTVATLPVTREACPGLGIMQLGPGGRVARFVEKPQDAGLVDSLRLDPAMALQAGIPQDRERYLASMGIYLFNRDLLFQVLDNDFADFGKHIIPHAIQHQRVFAHIFQGYWEDIGTIRSFFEANLDLVSELPRFNFFDMTAPIYSRARFLPASKVNGAEIDHGIISDGCILTRCRVQSSIVGLRCLVDEGARISRSVIMGADFYESAESIQRYAEEGRPRIGIGKHAVIENAIIDKNARIGDHCVLTPHDKPADLDHPLYYVRDGILIVPRDGVIPHGTVI